jgi:hypothetical protein
MGGAPAPTHPQAHPQAVMQQLRLESEPCLRTKAMMTPMLVKMSVE